MRSAREIRFRLSQEVHNLKQFAFAPHVSKNVTLQPFGWPDAEIVANLLRGTDFAAQTVSIADQILEHRFPMFGSAIETGRDIRWRRDYLNGIETGTQYFRLVPYLDVSQAGDHKNIWELNRHQHLVLLAQAYRFTENAAYLNEIEAQLQSWFSQNPYGRGINWTSALEVAFRAVSWLWLYHLVSARLTGNTRSQLSRGLYQHARHLEHNLSVYFSPNTHLLGEAVALHALGRFFGLTKWTKSGAKIVEQELARQVQADGSHFEQSTYYHVYAVDMFVFHAVLDEDFLRRHHGRLTAMANFLAAIMGPSRELAFIGDDDGGRWFYPYGIRSQFGRATLATCATLLGDGTLPFEPEDLYPQASWWLGTATGRNPPSARRSEAFPQSGLVVLQSEDIHVIFDAGSFGPGRAGHSHSDTLSLVVSSGEKRILVDSGTFTYVGDPAQRDAFRSSGAHNTIQIDGQDQATANGPFWWMEKPVVRLKTWNATEAFDDVTAECTYSGITHRRRVYFKKPSALLIVDTVEGPGGEHELKQTWHIGQPDMRSYFASGSQCAEVVCWHSPVFAQKHQTTCLQVSRKATLPTHFATVIAADASATWSVEELEACAEFSSATGETVSLDWS